MTDTPSRLILQPMIHVQDMAASITFYERLGAELVRGSRDGDRALLDIGGHQLSLLAHPPNLEQNEGTIELNFQAAGPLDDIAEQLDRAGISHPGPAAAEAFGRQLQIISPDGLPIKINEIHNNV